MVDLSINHLIETYHSKKLTSIDFRENYPYYSQAKMAGLALI